MALRPRPAPPLEGVAVVVHAVVGPPRAQLPVRRHRPLRHAGHLGGGGGGGGAGLVYLLVYRGEAGVGLRPEGGAVRVVVRGGAVGGAGVLVHVALPPVCHRARVRTARHGHVARQLAAGQDEEGLAADHDVGVVRVVVHLPRLLSRPGLPQLPRRQRGCHLHHLLAGVSPRVFAVTIISALP